MILYRQTKIIIMSGMFHLNFFNYINQYQYYLLYYIMHLNLYLWTKIQAVSFGLQNFVKLTEKLPFIKFFKRKNV